MWLWGLVTFGCEGQRPQGQPGCGEFPVPRAALYTAPASPLPSHLLHSSATQREKETAGLNGQRASGRPATYPPRPPR